MVGERLNPIETPYKRELFYLLQTQRFYDKPSHIYMPKLNSFIKEWRPRHYDKLNSYQEEAMACFSLANDLSRCIGIPGFLEQASPPCDYSYDKDSFKNRIVVTQAFKFIEEVCWFVKIVNGKRTYVLQPKKDMPLQLQNYDDFMRENRFLTATPSPTLTAT